MINKTLFEGVTFMDGIERNQACPESFHIPSIEEKNKITPGDHVKVCLCFEVPTKEGCTGERFWVYVTEVSKTFVKEEDTVKEKDLIKGQIVNDLVFPWGVNYFDIIEFQPKHVIQIHNFKVPKLTREEQGNIKLVCNDCQEQ